MVIYHYQKNLDSVLNMTDGNNIFEVYVIKTGEAEVPAPEVYWMEGWNTWEKLSFHALLLKGKELNFLINTGLPGDLNERNKSMVNFAGKRCVFRPYDIIRELKHFDIEPSEINGISFTPLQDYTTGGIRKFANARIFINRRGWIEDIVAPENKKHLPRNLFIPEEDLRYILFNAWDRVVLFDTLPDFNIADGINVTWVGCHHRSSLAFRILTGSGYITFSDCSFKGKNIEKNIPVGIAENTLECLDAYSKLRGHGKFLSAYDPDIDGLRF